MISGRGELSIRSSDAEHVIAVFNPLLFVCFTRAPRDTELAMIQAIGDDARKAGIRGGVLYVVARKDFIGGVDPRVRETFAKMMAANGDQSGSNAVVVSTVGLGGAMVRSALAGLMLLSKRRNQIRVFGSSTDAGTWLAKEHGVDTHALLRAWGRATAHLDVKS